MIKNLFMPKLGQFFWKAKKLGHSPHASVLSTVYVGLDKAGNCSLLAGLSLGGLDVDPSVFDPDL